MAVVRFFLAAISIVVTGCAGAQPNFDALMDTVGSRDECIAAIEHDLGGLRQQLSAVEIQSFIAELFAALPPRMRRVFTQAAAVVKDDISASLHDGRSKRALIDRLREATRQEFAGGLYPSIDNCGFAAADIVPNFIYRFQRLDRAPLVERFEHIGLEDSYWIEQAVLLMLTMEASGTDWRAEWFSVIAVMD